MATMTCFAAWLIMEAIPGFLVKFVATLKTLRVRQMPVNPQVRMHSIIGHGYPTIGSGNSDGVVPVDSARHPGVQTETFVRAWHTEIHSHPETLQALLYILSAHYAEYDRDAEETGLSRRP